MAHESAAAAAAAAAAASPGFVDGAAKSAKEPMTELLVADLATAERARLWTSIAATLRALLHEREAVCFELDVARARVSLAASDHNDAVWVEFEDGSHSHSNPARKKGRAKPLRLAVDVSKYYLCLRAVTQLGQAQNSSKQSKATDGGEDGEAGDGKQKEPGLAKLVYVRDGAEHVLSFRSTRPDGGLSARFDLRLLDDDADETKKNGEIPGWVPSSSSSSSPSFDRQQIGLRLSTRPARLKQLVADVASAPESDLVLQVDAQQRTLTLVALAGEKSETVRRRVLTAEKEDPEEDEADRGFEIAFFGPVQAPAADPASSSADSIHTLKDAQSEDGKTWSVCCSAEPFFRFSESARQQPVFVVLRPGAPVVISQPLASGFLRVTARPKSLPAALSSSSSVS